MRRGSDDVGVESKGRQRAWQAWLSTPRVVLTATGVGLLGVSVGYLITVLFVFPSENVAADLTRVPDLVGEDSLRARQVLEGAGLGYEEAVGMHGSVPEGTVVAQEPLPGQRTQPGSTVRVTLSLGPRTRSVPDVIGLGHEQATVVLGQSGYDSELVRVDAEAEVGTVVATEPDPGTPLEVPGRVRVRVSAGPPRVRVPDLTALSLSDAQATLESLGLRAGAIRWTAADSLAPNSVVGQAPQAGVEVEREEKIDLVVARLLADTSVTPGDSVISPPDTARLEVDTIGPQIRDRRDGTTDGR